jgi:elongation factor Ts
VTLPDGDEGFLPREEEAAALFTLIGHSGLEVGQEVDVKVLNVSRGQVNLTMKGGDNDEDELASLNTNLKQGWSRGTNAFELAFRKSKEISAFLDQREKITVPEAQAEVETETSVATSEVDSKVDELVEPPALSATEVESKEENSSSAEAVTGTIEEITPVAEEPEASVEEVPATASTESVDKEAALETEEVVASSENTTEVAAAGAGEASTTTGQQ